MIKIEMDEAEVKKAVEAYVARKFQISPDSVTKVELPAYSWNAIVHLEEEVDE